jgi:protein subunit release factor A
MNNALSNIAIQGNLNMDDVLSVVTSRAERSFNTSFAEAKTKVSSLEKAIKAKQTEIKKRTDEECLALVTDKANAARPGIEALGGTVTALAQGCSREGNLQASIEIKKGNGGYNSSVDFSYKGDKSKVLLAMEQELTDLQEKLSEATQEAMGWKKKISSIPTLERQYKAKIAEAKLASSQDGQALLDLLTEDLEQNMLALPAN